MGLMLLRAKVFDLDELLKFVQEQRVYRFRCVEGWSMVIPWIGFPLSKLIEKVEPMSQARYVSFQTLHDPKRLPNQRTNVLDWPYVEGLRIDEAMHPLAILATGLYGQVLPPQDGVTEEADRHRPDADEAVERDLGRELARVHRLVQDRQCL